EGRADFAIETLGDGTVLSLGEVELEIMETPGHTPESICVIVRERPGTEPYGVLTGDTLFIGDVGRPDLLASFGVTADELARSLYASVRRVMALPDATRVFPAHGAGSACGKHLSNETESTIGDQRRSNYAVAPMTEEQFVAVVTDGQPTAPLYFAFDATMNRQARDLLDEHSAPAPLTLDEAVALKGAGAVVVDTREAADYARGHLRGSLNVGLGGRFAEYTGDVVRPDQEIVLVCDPGHEMESKVRLARIGFDRVVGVLSEPLLAFIDHPDLVDQSSRLTAGELADRTGALPDLQVVDVRNPGEVRLGVIPGSIHVPLPRLLDRLGELDPDRPTVVVCASGFRSSVGASVLTSNGFRDVSDLLGGFEAWANAGFPIEHLQDAES
ncbi:MAG TPA: rhodanese-like domain-containing protein, partial [Acidimicrobiales bacterium]